MTDPTIDRLLQSLPDAVVPEPAVAERIRARVATELREQDAAELVVVPDLEPAEVTAPAGPTSQPTDRPDRRRIARGVLVAAAAVVLAAAIGSVLTSGGDDDSVRGVADGGTDRTDLPVPATVPPDAASSYRGGQASMLDLGMMNPYRVAPGDDVVWVVSLDGVVVEVDPGTLELEGQFQISESSLVAAGHGSLWVADATTGQVLRYRGADVGSGAASDPTRATVIETGARVDPSTFRDGRLGMLEGPRRRFARIGSITTGPGVVWVTDLDGRVLRIDPETDRVVQVIDVDLEPHLVRAEGRYVAVADQDAEVAAVYDIVTEEEVLRLEDIDALIGLDLHRAALFVHDGGAGTVTRYDVATGDASAVATLTRLREPMLVPLFPPALRATDAGVLVPDETELLILDADTLDVVRHLDVDGRAGEVAIGSDGTAWIAQFYGRTLTRLEPARS
ncbi:MAG TPA: hypothetical protein VFU14_14475 [Acidimicrobiales bacterium]|nr:hypothetical protein [Acidimicrobiales bacterium]